MFYHKIQRLWRFLLNQEGQQPRVPYSNFNEILKKVRLFATKNSSNLLTISDICETKIKVLKKLWFHSKTKMQFCKDIEHEVCTNREGIKDELVGISIRYFLFNLRHFFSFLTLFSWFKHRTIVSLNLIWFFFLLLWQISVNTLMNLRVCVMIHFNLDS